MTEIQHPKFWKNNTVLWTSLTLEARNSLNMYLNHLKFMETPPLPVQTKVLGLASNLFSICFRPH